MKLLFCRRCRDIFNLTLKQTKACGCGHARGRYIDQLNAEFSGKDAVPIGIDNYSFFARINPQKQPEANTLYDTWHGNGRIQCWVIELGAAGVETIKRVPRTQLGTKGEGTL